jgi:hypothetical protein
MLLEGAKPGSLSHQKLMKIVFAATNSNEDALRESIKDLATSITAANDINNLGRQFRLGEKRYSTPRCLRENA